MWLRRVHHFIFYCYNQIATGSNLRGELFWVTLRGWNLPWQGRNGCGSKRQLVTCMHIQNEGKGATGVLFFTFPSILDPSPCGDATHIPLPGHSRDTTLEIPSWTYILLGLGNALGVPYLIKLAKSMIK